MERFDVTLKKLAQHFAGEDVEGFKDVNMGEILPEVVSFLNGKSVRKVKLASTIIAIATETEENRGIIVLAGAIPLLVSLLNSSNNQNGGDLFMETNAAKSLYNIAEDVLYQKQIALHGAIPPLVNIIKTSEKEEIGRIALGTIKKLYKNSDCRQFINHSGIDKSLLKRKSYRIASLMLTITGNKKKTDQRKQLKNSFKSDEPRVEVFRTSRRDPKRSAESEDVFKTAKLSLSDPEIQEIFLPKRPLETSSRRRAPARSFSDPPKKTSISASVKPGNAAFRKSMTTTNKSKPTTNLVAPNTFPLLPAGAGSLSTTPQVKTSRPKTSFEISRNDRSSPKTSYELSLRADLQSPKSSFDRSADRSSPKIEGNSPKTSMDRGSPNKSGSHKSRIRYRSRSLSDTDGEFHREFNANTVSFKCIWDADKRFVWVDKSIQVKELINAIESKYDRQITTEQIKFRDPWAKDDLMTITTRQDIRTCFKYSPVEIYVTQNTSPPITPTFNMTPTRSPRVRQGMVKSGKYQVSNTPGPIPNIISPNDDDKDDDKPRRRRRQTAETVKSYPGVQERDPRKLELENRLQHYHIIKSADIKIPLQKEPLGQGYFGEVRLGYWRNVPVACKKVYEKSFRNKSDQEMFLREVNILSNLSHPHIVQFLGVCIDGKDKMIITEFMEGGSLNQKLRQNGFKLDSATLLKIASDIALGMEHLHYQQVLHRDLTSRNILLTANMDAKVADFGLSKKKLDNCSVSFTMGSLAWMAPEVLTNPKNFTKKSDVYSYGMVIWELFSGGKDPCPKVFSHIILANKVINEDWRPSLPHTCPLEWSSFIEQCWAQNPAKRPLFKSINETLKSWIHNPPEIKEGSGNYLDWDEDSQLSEVEIAGSEATTETSQSPTSLENQGYDDAIS